MKESQNTFKLVFLASLLVFFPNTKKLYAGLGLPSQTHKKAYIIALGEFEKGSGWPHINVERDVYYLEKAFQNQGFMKENIHTFMNQKTTKKEVLQILENAKNSAYRGDIIHLHFSGMGLLLEKQNNELEKTKINELELYLKNLDKKDKEGNVIQNNSTDFSKKQILDSLTALLFNMKFDRAIACYDSPTIPLTVDTLTGIILEDNRSKYLTTGEINLIIKELAERIGPSGQLVLSFDASNSGPNKAEIQLDNGITIANRGGVFEMTNKSFRCPIVIFASSLLNENSYETRDSENKKVGVWSYAFYRSTILKNSQTFRQLAEEINKKIVEINPRQTPVAAGILDLIAYQSAPKFKRLSHQSIQKPKDTLLHNVFVLSIGISEYKLDTKTVFAFNNAASDAVAFVDFIKKEHELVKGNRSTFFGKVLTNQQATKENIIKELNEIISKAQHDDYFFFNFSGLSWELEDENQATDIYFYPMLSYDVSDSAGQNFKNPKDKLGLKQLKELFEFINAQNQLIISEAGATPNFQKIFAKSLIESSPTIAELSKRNRVIIAPRNFGYDECFCAQEKINQAPFSYYLSLNQNKGHHIFSLFSTDIDVRKKYEYETLKREVECGMHPEPYTTFFHEREFVETLQYFTPEETSNSRGLLTIQMKPKTALPKFGEKHALIIGINDYKKGAPTWKDLNNPIEDAKDIEVVLREMYGFKTKLMLNTELDSVLAVLKEYSNTLQENDQFILFLAGHGDYDPYFFDDGFLVLSNSLSHAKDPNKRTYLPFGQLRNIIDNLPPQQVLLMVDICFGGAFDSKISAGSKRSGQATYEDVSIAKMLAYKIDLKTRIVLSSGSINEVPDGFKGRNSPFASRIVSGLRTGGGERKVLTTIQLFEFVQWLPSKPIRGELPGNEGGAEFFLIAN